MQKLILGRSNLIIGYQGEMLFMLCLGGYYLGRHETQIVKTTLVS